MKHEIKDLTLAIVLLVILAFLEGISRIFIFLNRYFGGIKNAKDLAGIFEYYCYWSLGFLVVFLIITIVLWRVTKKKPS